MTHGRQLVYDYDDAGNQTSRSIPNAPDKGWTLTWDLENRLTRMEKFRKVNNIIVESRIIDFKYDPFDRRIEKKLTTFINDVTKTATWNYQYDGDNIAVEYFTDNSGTPPTTTTTYYTHGPGVDEHLAMERGGVDYYYHADGLGSVTAITDSSSSPAIVQSYSYDSFGVPRQTQPNFPNSFMYTGREWDKETGLYYYRARYYDPMEGRFISEDPIPLQNRSQDQLNSYTYVQNNPVNLIDPDGLCAIAFARATLWLLPRIGIGVVCPLPPICKSTVDEKKCEENLTRDLATCAALGKRDGKSAYAICARQAYARYGNCLAGSSVKPPLPPWGTK